jgi:predicted dehydrogenase/threonine dehydrogenase-like Zn-dependent dehydrogenase
MRQVVIRRGSVSTERVPAPRVSSHSILVRTSFSCVSSGTEMAGVRGSAEPLWRRSLAQPQKAVAALQAALRNGVTEVAREIAWRGNLPMATGYSASGVVVGVGAAVQGFAVGDQVACAGAGFANHADYVSVPQNLAVKVPSGVSLEDAATATVGAIALQGVRRASPTLGETVVVFGLGLLGQLTAQLLTRAGCNVIGIDTLEQRVSLAASLGVARGVVAGSGDVCAKVYELTDGVGADAVIIAAASNSDEVVSQAFRMSRRKGRVVLLGDVGLDLRREDFYEKELDFLVSTSYGPGRYDPAYENGSSDYPIAYVRWTLARNLAAYLEQVATGGVRLKPLLASTFPVENASEAFELVAGETRPILVLLAYSPDPTSPLVRRFDFPPTTTRRASGQIRVGLIGPGSFARASYFPNIARNSDMFQLCALAGSSGLNLKELALRYGASYVTTDVNELLADPEIDAVIITTRHNTHGALALAALSAGKHVLVEKPLALARDELDQIEGFYADRSGRPVPVLTTGFNRRFSPHGLALASLVRRSTAPFIFNYRMNAGYLPNGHWVHGPEGGGRNVGEACHIYDLFAALANSDVETWSAQSLGVTGGYYRRNDNFVVTFAFNSGSIASLTYTALGGAGFPKETAELFVDGKVASLNDYVSLAINGEVHKPKRRGAQDKGHAQLLRAFGAAIRGEGWPIPLSQQLLVSRLALDIEDALVGE